MTRHIVLYDDECSMCTFQMKVLSWLDWFDVLALTPLSDPRAKEASELSAEIWTAGDWIGELSSGGLSTATAVVALGQVDAKAHRGLIRGGLSWLAEHQNADGGWGDTVKSRSNISTTALGW